MAKKQPTTESPEFLEILKQWSETRSQAALLAIKESELRTQVFKLAFPEVDKNEDQKGTFNIALPHEWKLKAEVKHNVSVDAALLSNIKQNLIDVHKLPIDVIFKYKPDLSLAEYNKLSDVAKTLLSNIVTFKRGKPALELVPPKAKDILKE